MVKILKIKEKLQVFVHRNLTWLISCFAITLLIKFGWQGLELLFYGEIQHRIVDDIIAFILLWSILTNVLFVRTIYLPKSDRSKYIVLDKEKYSSFQKKKYEEFYCVLNTLKNNLKVADLIISDTIKNENGEETNTVQFDSMKSFAQYMKCFNDINIRYIEKELDKKENI